jgi:hypothetical protein
MNKDRKSSLKKGKEEVQYYYVHEASLKMSTPDGGWTLP